jgi:hypothetical protein
MDMPRSSAAHARLEAFVGSWEGKETLSPSPVSEGGTAHGRFVYRMDLDGFFLVSDYVEEKDGKTVYRGHGVYGYDPESDEYTMYWFDSMGGGGYEAPARGRWDEDRLVFRNETPAGFARYTHALAPDGGYRFKLETSPDGEAWSPVMQGNYARV